MNSVSRPIKSLMSARTVVSPTMVLADPNRHFGVNFESAHSGANVEALTLRFSMMLENLENVGERLYSPRAFLSALSNADAISAYLQVFALSRDNPVF